MRAPRGRDKHRELVGADELLDRRPFTKSHDWYEVLGPRRCLACGWIETEGLDTVVDSYDNSSLEDAFGR